MGTNWTVLGWHFTEGLKYRDGSPLIVGEPAGPGISPEVCYQGYHASSLAINAHCYQPGCQLSRTEHSGRISYDLDKFCSEFRTPLWTIDATRICVEFAHACIRSLEIEVRASYIPTAEMAISDPEPRLFYAREALKYPDPAGWSVIAGYARIASGHPWIERMWQEVVLLQMIYDELTRLMEAA